MAEGFICEVEQNGSFRKAPTDKGKALGIKGIERFSEKGYEYTMLAYPPRIQRLLVEKYIGGGENEDPDREVAGEEDADS